MKDPINILQICSYYGGSKLHKKLFNELDKHIMQTVYVPLRERKKMYSNITKFNNGKLVYEKIWSWYHRILYKVKIKKAFNALSSSNEKFNYDLIHAHTWFSDGGIAWLLHRKYNKPYIISIRNTDLNLFYKKRIFLRKTGHSILKDAAGIVFLSPSYYNKLCQLLPGNLKEIVKSKSIVNPNGIDKFWFENKPVKRNIPLKDDKFKILFIGDINRNKNVRKSIKSFLLLKDSKIDATFTMVGFRDKSIFEKRLKRKYNSVKNLNFIDLISNKTSLLKYYRESHLFLMPSFTESFGLVYIEALSQSLPVIFSRGQGIDGYFNNRNIGLSVNPYSTEEISKAIQQIRINYEEYIQSDLSYLSQFKWNNIANNYLKLYKEIVTGN